MVGISVGVVAYHMCVTGTISEICIRRICGVVLLHYATPAAAAAAAATTSLTAALRVSCSALCCTVQSPDMSGVQRWPGVQRCSNSIVAAARLIR